ncbi:MAG: glycoside hydrolase family 78 protein [Gorillibacterium sp.]|nr:glycoside hydrolase family 78 protein [Gorillibacterium sp.]
MLTLERLTVEDQINPLGIDVVNPSFSWSFGPTEARSLFQQAYRIVVGVDPKLQEEVGEILWDSGRLESPDQINILYQGPTLVSRQIYYWFVTVWSSEGKAVESTTASWEMGLLNPSDWQAQWIGADLLSTKGWEPVDGYVNSRPQPLFRREMTLDRPFRKARAYICGLGQFELRVNGEKVGDHVLEPGWTHYNIGCLYVTHDLTDMLVQGENAIGIMLGNGFYNINDEDGRYIKRGMQRNKPARSVIQGDPSVIVQIVLEYEDGVTEILSSNEEWQAASGPIVYSCMYGGEDYDARRELPGWDKPGFAMDDRWSTAVIVEGPGGILCAERTSPNKVMATILPVSWSEPEPGIYVADLGQNFSGWFNLQVSGGVTGQRVKVIPAELIDAKGKVRQELQQQGEAANTFTYTLKGTGKECWHPRFTYTGYRYIQIEGVIPRSLVAEGGNDGLPVLEQLEGQLIYPDIQTIGHFASSNPLWNRIHEIINWAIISNVKSVFTDCPHREKLGWLEQTHLMGPAVLYNYDLPNLLRKSVRDMSQSQLPTGLVPSISPEYAVFEGGFRDSPEWGGAYVFVPWYLYHWSKDRRILEEHYEGMARYVNYLEKCSRDGIVSHGLGDWADVGPNPPFAQNTPIPVTATAYYYAMLRILEQVATLLGELAAATEFAEQATEVNTAFHSQFFHEADNLYGSGSQTSNATPISLGMTAAPQISHVLSHICRDIEERGWHTTSGDVGHRLVLQALANGGRSDVIAAMLNQTDDPSYGYQVLHGATALTEHWDGPTSGKSQNHFMLGHVEEWFYRHLAGIVRDYDGSGPETADLLIKPFIAKDIDWVMASHRLPQGEVHVKWQREESCSLSLKVVLPPNVHALIYVPMSEGSTVYESGKPIEAVAGIASVAVSDGYLVVQAGSGSYTFQSKLA